MKRIPDETLRSMSLKKGTALYARDIVTNDDTSRDDEAILQRMIDDDEILFRVGPIRVTQRDFNSVYKSHKCANDTILDFYTKAMEAAMPNLRAHVFHAQFYNALRAAYNTLQSQEKALFGPKTSEKDLKSVSSRFFRNSASVFNCDIKEKCIFNCDLMFIPVCRKEHWFTILVTDPKKFFLTHLSQSHLTNLYDRGVDFPSCRRVKRSVALEDHVFRRAGKRCRASPQHYNLKSSSIAGKIEASMSMMHDMSIGDFLKHDGTPVKSSTRIFLLDSMMHPREVTSDADAQRLRFLMSKLVRPIALFLIRRWHDELCIALERSCVLSDMELRDLYFSLIQPMPVKRVFLVVPQQELFSLDCGYFCAHLIEILRHPKSSAILLEKIHAMEGQEAENDRRLFRNLVFNSSFTTQNLFSAESVRGKRKHIARLMYAIGKDKHVTNGASPWTAATFLSQSTDPQVEYIVNNIDS